MVSTQQHIWGPSADSEDFCDFFLWRINENKVKKIGWFILFDTYSIGPITVYFTVCKSPHLGVHINCFYLIVVGLGMDRKCIEKMWTNCVVIVWENKYIFRVPVSAYGWMCGSRVCSIIRIKFKDPEFPRIATKSIDIGVHEIQPLGFFKIQLRLFSDSGYSEW